MEPAPSNDQLILLDGSETPIWIPEGAYYDPTLPQRFIDFSAAFLRWPSGKFAGEPAIWEQWQLDSIIHPALGIRWEKDDELITRTVFLFCSRGNGKTAIAAAFGLFGLAAMGEPHPEVDLFAVSREQAGRMWAACEKFVRASPELQEELTIYDSRRMIRYGPVGGELIVRSGDATVEVGLNPSMALVDELLSQKSRDLWDVVTSSAGKRKHTLIMSMTTPSLEGNIELFARQEYAYAKAVQKERSIDPTYLPAIFEASPDDDYFAEETWHKAAPGLKSGMLDIGVYRAEAARAQRDLVSLHQFKVFRLALWAESGHAFIPLTVWDANAAELPEIDELKRMKCYAGIDMAGTADLASWCLLWVDGEGCMYALWRHWTTSKMREDLVDWTAGAWRVWEQSEACQVTVVPGDWIDGEVVAQQILDDWKVFKPETIGLDSMRSRELNRLLTQEANIPTQLLNQSGRSMQAATERVAAMSGIQQLRHNGDPLTRWMVSCTHVRYDPQNFPKLVKSDLTARHAKIDATAALAMAVDRRLEWEREHLELVPPPRAIRI